jgi:hypothetical protein
MTGMSPDWISPVTRRLRRIGCFALVVTAFVCLCGGLVQIVINLAAPDGPHSRDLVPWLLRSGAVSLFVINVWAVVTLVQGSWQDWRQRLRASHIPFQLALTAFLALTAAVLLAWLIRSF